MPKQFIRQFDASNYKHGARGIYSMAIRTRGDYVFLRGQTGFDLDGNFVGQGRRRRAGRAGVQEHPAAHGGSRRDHHGRLQADRVS